MDLTELWPLFGLRITTPRLELRIPTDDDLVGLVSAVRAGVHDPSSTPFVVPWTDAESPDLERGALQYWWRNRAEFSPDNWDLTFAVVHEGVVVGAQNLMANGFPRVGVAVTGSWLGLAHHGQGIGQEMRRAILFFAFDALGATAVHSTAFEDNAASQRVSLAVGYEPNGVSRSRRRDGASDNMHFRITRQRWEDTRTELPIHIDGLEACVEMFALKA